MPNYLEQFDTYFVTRSLVVDVPPPKPTLVASYQTMDYCAIYDPNYKKPPCYAPQSQGYGYQGGYTGQYR